MKNIFKIPQAAKGLEYRLSIYALLLILSLTIGTFVYAETAPPVKMPEKPSYTGATLCNGRCHDPWYQAWKDTPHAKTYELLKPGIRAEFKRRGGLNPNADYTKDPNCLRCHTTGYGQKGGFIPGKTPVNAGEPNLEQVGCEMCHTARGGNQARVIMKKSEGKFKRAQIEAWGGRYDYENVCRRCHGHKKTPHPQRQINYGEKKKGVHEYDKYYNDYNKTQVYRIDHGKGVTEAHPLMIEDWDIVDKDIRFKKLPLWEGWLIFKR